MICSICLHSKKVFMIICLATLIGCANTAPSRFYSLSATPVSPTETVSNPIESRIALGVGPLKLPDYLDRPQIIIRENRNEITMAEYDRWAGRLGSGMLRVISENLSTILSTDRIVVYPWRSAMPMDYQVEIEIMQFDGKPGQNVTLIARWYIIESKTKEVLTIRRSRINEAVGAQSYSAMVEAQSRLLHTLCREISLNIQDLNQCH